MIRKIMKTIGVLLIAAIVAAIVVLCIKVPIAGIPIAGMCVLSNLVIWIVQLIDAETYSDIEEVTDTLWHKINLAVYTAGIGWLVIGLIYLWENDSEIEEKIKKWRKK